MKYYITNNIHIVEIPVKDFSIVMNDSSKKTAKKKNYCNAGFFATYKENKSIFTLPVGHLICDYEGTNQYTKKYCESRGKFISNNKFQFDNSTFSYMNQFYNKEISTLLIKNNKAIIEDVKNLQDKYDYAITGIPIMKNGLDVKFNPYVKNQGWTGQELYGTWHIFIGLKKDNNNVIYVMGMKTISSNMISSAEAFKKFKSIGMYNVIKLDGGGSFHLNVNGKVVASTLENRRINTIICWEDNNTENIQNNINNKKNPFPVPTVALKKGNKYINFNKWLQWQLNLLGFKCDIDGSFGPGTLKQVLLFQKSKNLTQDGVVGPATKEALLK